MTRSSRGTILLSWLMLLGGGASLFACLLLPPWLEYQAARRDHALRRQEVPDLEARVTRADKQIEHHHTDPAYIERLNRREFGIEPPGVELIRVAPRGSPATAPAVGEPERREQLDTTVERATRTNAFIAVFVLDATRPVVMAMSVVILVMALLLMRGRASKPL